MEVLAFASICIVIRHYYTGSSNAISKKDVQDAKVAYTCLAICEHRSYVNHASHASGYAQIASLLQLPSHSLDFLGLVCWTIETLFSLLSRVVPSTLRTHLLK